MIFTYAIFLLLGLLLLLMALVRTILYCAGAYRLADKSRAGRLRRVRSIRREFLAAALSLARRSSPPRCYEKEENKRKQKRLRRSSCGCNSEIRIRSVIANERIKQNRKEMTAPAWPESPALIRKTHR